MNATEQFIYLCACGAGGQKAALQEADFDRLWKMAQGHNLTALLAKALQGTAAFAGAGKDEQFRWSNALNNNIKKSMLFDRERQKLLAFFEENGIWYLPLKGAVINGLYPTYGTREFADNDILMDNTRTDDARAYMQAQGYRLRSDEFSADEYSKKPFYNFELHRTLVDRQPGTEQYYAYYRNLKSRLRKEDDNGYGYCFTDEDFYIYFIYHAYKHYDSRGTGFRTVADEYVLLHSSHFHFDFKYMEQELRELGLLTFERQLRSLADALFSEPENTAENLRGLSPEDSGMLRYILGSGTFGSMDNLFAKELQSSGETSKAKYYLKRIFPPVSTYRYTHPFVYRHKIVYPFFWVYRTAVNPIKHRKYLKKEVRSIKKLTDEHN